MSTEAITPESYETGAIATRSDAESHAVELERLNEELMKVAVRATKLLDVTAALSHPWCRDTFSFTLPAVPA